MKSEKSEKPYTLWIAAAAAFSTYFCMYAFRKPFTAATYHDQTVFDVDLKSTLVLSQLLGYMLSKFIGIKVVSELDRRYRAAAIIGLIGIAEIALVLFAFVPPPLKVAAMFFNGLPLGMIFGFVLSYLEGRKQTEALSAALCASFIISSGVVKSVGQWLIQRFGVSDFQMPMLTGLIFLPPLLISVWLLQKTPPPGPLDIEQRRQRLEMFAADRIRFFSAYWPGLCLLLLVYIVLTVIRTIRDDFGVEIWRDLGVTEQPSIFAQSETLIAVLVTALNAIAICFHHNLKAIRAIVTIMCLAFLVTFLSPWFQSRGWISPFTFMVLGGVGLYIPYVAFHTTVFERILAASRIPGNLGFLMYLADSIGYLGYATVLSARNFVQTPEKMLPIFSWMLYGSAVISIISLIVATVYFHRVLEPDPSAPSIADSSRPTSATDLPDSPDSPAAN